VEVHERDRYIEGFLAGQVVAYCERVNTGSGLAGQIACPRAYVNKLIALVANEGCESVIEEINPERVSLWIYRDKLVKCLIDYLQSGPEAQTKLGAWGMGKLFGYSDRQVLDFIERS
jgi:hypothetical protein